MVPKSNNPKKTTLKNKIGDNYSVSMYRKLARKGAGLKDIELKRSLKNYANHVILEERVAQKLRTLNSSEIDKGIHVINKIYDKIFRAEYPKNKDKYEKMVVSLAKDINKKEGVEVLKILQEYEKLI